MDIGGILTSADLFDLIAVLFLMGMFVLGFFQGTIRRLLGLVCIIFSFLLACQLRAPLGNYLAQNWTQFSPQYSYMLAFGFTFAFSAILFSIIIQSFYKHQELFKEAKLADELIGGALGVLEGAILIGIMIVILDSFFRIPGIPISSNELKPLRSIFEFYDTSSTAQLFRDTLIPAVFAITGPLVPDEIKAFFGTSTSAALLRL